MLERKGQKGEKHRRHSGGNEWPLERRGLAGEGKAKWQEGGGL